MRPYTKNCFHYDERQVSKTYHVFGFSPMHYLEAIFSDHIIMVVLFETQTSQFLLFLVRSLRRLHKILLAEKCSSLTVSY